MDAPLTEDELRLWHAWKSATEHVRERVAEDIKTATGLSDPDFGVLTRLLDLGQGTLRQQELATSMGWHRSRLSHQLTRMEQRNLLTRASTDGGVNVVITSTGREAAAVARPVHAEAVRRHLINRAPRREAAALIQLLQALGDD